MRLIACVLLAGMAVGQSKSTGICSSLDGGPEWAPRADGVCYQADKPVIPPRSVPAVRKTRKVPAHYSCGGFSQLQPETLAFACMDILIPESTEEYWTCADPDRALIVSQNGKKAACWLVESE